MEICPASKWEISSASRQYPSLSPCGGAQVWLPVTKDFEAVNSKSVCVEHPCVPSQTLDKNLFCGDELIYKEPYEVDLDQPQECDIRDVLCEPKSGTCKPDRRGHGSQEDMLFVTNAS